MTGRGRVTGKILAAIIGAVVVIGAVFAFVAVPSPKGTAASFVQALPGGAQTLRSDATPQLWADSGFQRVLAQWRARDRAQRMVVHPCGPVR